MMADGRHDLEVLNAKHNQFGAVSATQPCPPTGAPTRVSVTSLSRQDTDISRTNASWCHLHILQVILLTQKFMFHHGHKCSCTQPLSLLASYKSDGRDAKTGQFTITSGSWMTGERKLSCPPFAKIK